MRFGLAATVLAPILPLSVVASVQTTVTKEEGKAQGHHANRFQPRIHQRSRQERLEDLLLLYNDTPPQPSTTTTTTTTTTTRRLRNRNTARLGECTPTTGTATGTSSADIGVLECGTDEYCLESSTSTTGGICVATATAATLASSSEHTRSSPYEFSTPRSQSRRRLQEDRFSSDVCDEDFGGAPVESCDCSDFDSTSGLGTFGCTISSYTCFFEGYCGEWTFSKTILEDRVVSEYCYGFTVPEEVQICYEVSTLPSCALQVNGIPCNSCEIVNLVGDGLPGCYEFDCRNTIANSAGNDCQDEYLVESIFPMIFDTETQAPDFVCQLCADGSDPTNLQAMVEFPGLAPLTCADLIVAAEDGSIIQTQCDLLQPFIQEPCGCGDYATVTPVTPEPSPPPTTAAPVAQPTAAPVATTPPDDECVTSSIEILARQLLTPPITDIVICPGTTIEVGTPSNPEFSEFSNGESPITIIRDNVRLRCGQDGQVSNNCVLSGGFAQLVALPNYPLVAGKISVHNLRVQGLTFTGALSEIPGVPSQSILLSAPGDNILIEDCLFENLQGDYIIANSRDVLTPYDDYPPFSCTATIKDSTFRDILYNLEIIHNTDQTMNLENLQFQDCVHVGDGITMSPGSIILNQRGVMSLTNSDFRDLEVFSTALYWLASSNTTTLEYSGNIGEDIVVVDADNRDPASFCLEGLLVDSVQDATLTGECRILFDNLSSAPTQVPTPMPTTLSPTKAPTPAPTQPEATLRPTATSTTRSPTTVRPTINLPPLTRMPSSMPMVGTMRPTGGNIDMSMSMSYSYDPYRDGYRHPREIWEDLDSEFGLV